MSQSSGGVSSTVRSYWTAAFETIACGPPCRSAAAITASTWSAAETSQTWASARPPAASMSATVACAPSPSMSAHSVSAPSAARRSAIALPMPVPAPVTTQTLSCMRTCPFLSMWERPSSPSLTIK